MREIDRTAPAGSYLTEEEIGRALAEFLAGERPRRVLLLPPDYTRLHSRAGMITAKLVETLSPSCEVDVMPALGTHVPVSPEECRALFGDAVPWEKLIVHDWRRDVARIGTVPREFVREVSEGCVDEEIPVEVNRRLLDPEYDLILSIGQVVPHEVAGMANRTKNIFVGCGGSAMINASHMLGAFYGLERIMGRDETPVRAVFDYAEEHFLGNVPLAYILTVCTAEGVRGVFLGKERERFRRAAALSREVNLIFPEKPIRKAVVHLDPVEFKSTWLGNKSVYRTRMAIADGGELVVLAPGVERFGEDPECDRLIRRYGYCGRENILRLCREKEDLRGNMSAAAHLIHGSGDGRFSVTYCTEPARLGRAEVEGVCYGFLPYAEAAARYDPARLRDGWNLLPDGEEIYYISNPALGLWALRSRL